MTERSINMKAKRLMELEAEAKLLGYRIDELKKEIQTEMGEQEELKTNHYLIKWTLFSQASFDTKGFKVAHPDLYNVFAKDKQMRRFSVKELQ